MPDLFSQLKEDVRFVEGLNACINCGTCTAICPAAEVYDYDPRIIADTVQTRNQGLIEELLKSEEIWYCGECMSCKTRCPRDNTPGLIIIALRNLSQKLGYFTESEKGRQQLVLKRTIGEHILQFGYSVYAPEISTDIFPEQGPVWDWVKSNIDDVYLRLGANLNKSGAGSLRKMDEADLDDLQRIFEVTGANERYELIEKLSEEKANEMQIPFDKTKLNEYFLKSSNENGKNHHSF